MYIQEYDFMRCVEQGFRSVHDNHSAPSEMARFELLQADGGVQKGVRGKDSGEVKKRP